MLKRTTLFIFMILIFAACANQESKQTAKKEVSTPEALPQPEPELSVEELKKLGIDESSVNSIKAIPVGTQAPDFTAKDQSGNTIQLSEITKEKDVVLVFYRGYWCGYCTKNLATYVEKLEEIEAKGATVIAIAPEGETYRDETVKSTGLEIPFISDANHKIMDAYGVAFKVTDDYDAKIKKFKGKTLSEINNEEEAFLPIPATYIIGKDRTVKWSFFDPNYRERPDVEEIMAQL